MNTQEFVERNMDTSPTLGKYLGENVSAKDGQAFVSRVSKTCRVVAAGVAIHKYSRNASYNCIQLTGLEESVSASPGLP